MFFNKRIQNILFILPIKDILVIDFISPLLAGKYKIKYKQNINMIRQDADLVKIPAQPTESAVALAKVDNGQWDMRL